MILRQGVSQKCRYALGAVLELALRDAQEPVKVRDIASARKIPPRFLEVILNELRHGGFVESRRGSEGGYLLARPAARISAGEVIRFIEGPGAAAAKRTSNPDRADSDVFLKMWVKVSSAIAKIYDSTTFADLAREELARKKAYVQDYAI